MLIAHAGLCSGKPKASVPWRAVTDSQSKFLSSSHIPAGAKIKDPSKLQGTEANALLTFWHSRQDNNVAPIFKFKGWLGADQEIQPPVTKDLSTGAEKRTRRPRRTATVIMDDVTTDNEESVIPIQKKRPNGRPPVTYNDSSADEEADIAPPKRHRQRMAKTTAVMAQDIFAKDTSSDSAPSANAAPPKRHHKRMAKTTAVTAEAIFAEPIASDSATTQPVGLHDEDAPPKKARAKAKAVDIGGPAEPPPVPSSSHSFGPASKLGVPEAGEEAPKGKARKRPLPDPVSDVPAKRTRSKAQPTLLAPKVRTKRVTRK